MAITRAEFNRAIQEKLLDIKFVDFSEGYSLSDSVFLQKINS